jgi:hypothetical protein
MENNMKFQFNCEALSLNWNRVFEYNGFRAEIIHRHGEPPNALRILVARDDLSIELLPSKGLSVGEVFYGKQPVFWDPPAELPDPDQLNLISPEIAIKGKPSKGFTYLKTFMAGIEFYGLRNWGMPRNDKNSGEIHPLHGESSNIPAKTVTGQFGEDYLEMTATFLYRRFSYDSEPPWYESGEPIYKITKTVILPSEANYFTVIDRVKNITESIMVPDWGYHITFRPEKGSKLLVPSKKTEERSGGKMPDDIETWYPAINPEIRNETGIIHKGLRIFEKDGKKVNKVLMFYPSGRGIALSFQPSPYFQTWFCNGGANTDEFTYSGNGQPVLTKNWDGQGIEIGSSSLDHDGNIDASAEYKESLQPGETLENEIKIEMLTSSQVKSLEDDIVSYNRLRRKT